MSSDQPPHEQASTETPSNSLGRRFWILLLSRWVQVGIIVVVLVLSYYLSRDGRVLATYIRITPDVAMQFLSALSQAIAALLAVSLAFLIFEIENIRSERNRAFETFRAQMIKLFELTRSRAPDSMNEFDAAVIAVMDRFAYISMDELPLRTNRSSPEVAAWEELTHQVIDVSEQMDSKGERDIPELLYQRQAQVTLTIAEDALNQAGLQRIGAVVSILIVRALIKVALVLAASLLLLLAFGTKDLKGMVPDLSVPVLFTLLAWLLVTLLDVAERARFVYRSAVE